MKAIVKIFCFACMAAFALAAKASELAADLRQAQSTGKPSSYYFIHIPADGSGPAQWWVSHDGNRNGASGLFWVVYVEDEAGVFRSIPDMPTLHPETVAVGKSPLFEGKGTVFAYLRGGGQEGTLMAYRVENGRLQSKCVGRLDLGGSQQQLLYRALFEEEGGKPVETVPAGKLAGFLAGKNLAGRD